MAFTGGFYRRCNSKFFLIKSTWQTQKTDLKYKIEIEIEFQFRFVRQNVQNEAVKTSRARYNAQNWLFGGGKFELQHKAEQNGIWHTARKQGPSSYGGRDFWEAQKKRGERR